MTRLGAILIGCIAFAASVLAHEGHDDGAKPAAPTAEIPRLESTGADLELVATAAGHKLTIYLDRLATNEPVDGAEIEVSGDGIAPVTARRISEGTYEIDAAWVDEPGTKALIFTVTVAGTTDLLNGTLEVHAAAPPTGAQPADWSHALASPWVWSIALIAGALGFVFAFAFRPLRLPPDESQAPTISLPRIKLARSDVDRVQKSAGLVLIALLTSGMPLPPPAFAGPGQDHGHEESGPAPAGGNAPRRLPDGNVFVPKPSQRLLRIRTSVATKQSAQTGTELIGTIIPDPSSAGQVQAPMDGQIELAERGISHAGQRVEAGEVLALLAPSIPVADLGTMQQLRAEVEGKLRIAEQKLARLTRVGPGIIAQRDIDDTRAELDALHEQKRVLAPKDIEKIALKAPVSGIISVANVRAGQVVTARDTLFEIVDPARLWIEAVRPGGHERDEIVAAHALDAEGHGIKLSYVGRSPALRQQLLSLLFRIEEPHDRLTIGSTVKVVTQGKAALEGVILPDSAVVLGPNGLPQVWTKVSAERFKPTQVRTTPLDGSRILVVAGIDDGSRVVVDGAELINQVR
jgi:RND family efflux transporter MFP subunit